MGNQVQKRSPDMAGLIKANLKAIQTVIPTHMDANRMARIALVETQRNKQLLESTPESFIGALITATQLGLEPGVGGMGYLIPYRNNKRGVTECQFVPGYKGLMDLARRTGKVSVITAETVHANDEFEYALGIDQKLRHVPAMGDRGPVVYVYAAACLYPSQKWQFRVLTRDDVEKVRKGSKAGNFGPWKDHWEEMAKKTVLRALVKYLPSSIEVQRVVAMDEMADAGVSQRNDAELPDEWIDVEAAPADEDEEQQADMKL